MSKCMKSTGHRIGLWRKLVSSSSALYCCYNIICTLPPSFAEPKGLPPYAMCCHWVFCQEDLSGTQHGTPAVQCPRRWGQMQPCFKAGLHPRRPTFACLLSQARRPLDIQQILIQGAQVKSWVPPLATAWLKLTCRPMVHCQWRTLLRK